MFKRIVILLAGCLPFFVQAQPLQLFVDVQPDPSEYRSLVKKSVGFRLNRELARQLYRNHPETIEFNFPVPGGSKNVRFTTNDVHATGFKVLNAQNQDVSQTLEMPHHYKFLTTKGKRQLAALSLFSNGDLVLVYSDETGNINLAKAPGKPASDNLYLTFSDSDLNQKNPFRCGIDSDSPVPSGNRTPGTNHQIQNDTSCRLTEIYWECDHDMYQKGGNSIQGALNQFEAMFNGTAVLFEAETINIGVKAVKVWNTPDPYTYASSFTALDDFMAAGNAANWPGQLAHLLSTRPLNLGGVAYLDAICTSIRYGFSNIDFLFNALPVYSWTLSTIAHELGHNFSSPHTHNCGWEVEPGVFGQIDSCWNAEGGCQPTIKGRVGTIMSYCHLTGSVNLAWGFGPLPGDRIRQAYADMPCVAGTIVIPNYTPENSGPICDGDTLILMAEEHPGHQYKWTGPNGFTSTERSPRIPNVSLSAEGKYSLSLRKAACESREKKTDVVFNCLQVGNTPNVICAGSTLAVPFTSTGVFNPGNQFILQLSNSTGSFANPVNLDTLTGTNPTTVVATLPGNLSLGNGYKVRFLSTNPVYTGKPPIRNLQINPVGTSPQPRNGERCGPGSVQLSATGGSNLIWFNTLSDFQPIFVGRNFATPFLSADQSFFVQSGSTTRSKIGPNPATGATQSTENAGIEFSVSGTLRLDSVLLSHPGTGAGQALCQIRLVKSGVTVYQQQVSSSGINQSAIPLFWRMDPGTGYSLVCENLQVPLAVSNSAWGSYPLNFPTLLQMEGSTLGNSQYPYLYSWTISKYSGCPSPKIEVKARIKPGTVPQTPTLSQEGDSISTPAGALVYQWQINGQIQNLNLPKVKGLQNSSYQVRIKTDSCWSEWSDPFVFTITSSAGLKSSAQASLFPNPGQGKVVWQGPADFAQVNIYNPEGKILWEGGLRNEESLDLSHLPKGLYFLKWQTQNHSGTLKWIRE